MSMWQPLIFTGYASFREVSSFEYLLIDFFPGKLDVGRFLKSGSDLFMLECFIPYQGSWYKRS